VTLNITERLDEAILIIETHAPLDGEMDPPQATEATLAFQKKVNGTICRITDYTRTPIPFDILVAGMSSDVAFRHPKVLSIVVGDDDMVRLVAEGFKQEQYGGIDVKLAASLEEALTLARGWLASS
jgi:hypothetical protein